MTRIEDHPGILSMLQALASDPHAIAPAAAAGFAERALGLIEALLSERASLEGQVSDLLCALTDLRCMADHQAEDAGLWFIAHTAPEAYLQHELRRLHAAIEREPLARGIAGGISQ